MKKKFLIVLISIACIFCIALGLAACNSGEKSDGTNNSTSDSELEEDNSGINYALSSNGKSYTITGIGTCEDTEIVIPSTYKGLSVTVITADAFKDQTQITSISIPDSITSIGLGAFSGCSGLTDITLPFIGGSSNASSASSSTLFGYIFGTSSYSGGTETYQYYDSSTRETTGTTYYIPTSLTTVTLTGGKILNGAFSGCSSLESITMPTNITSIGDNAFEDCKSITSVIIPGKVTSIGEYAFYGCTSLKSITFENTDKWYVDGSILPSTSVDYTQVLVTDASTNASNFTKYYYMYSWSRLTY